jgi:hypothetical protein
MDYAGGGWERVADGGIARHQGDKHAYRRCGTDPCLRRLDRAHAYPGSRKRGRSRRLPWGYEKVVQFRIWRSGGR